MSKLQLLETILGISHKANRDYVQFHCPFCHHRKPKLGINLVTGRWKCWVCATKGSSVQNLTKRIGKEIYLNEVNTLFKPVYERVKLEVNSQLVHLPKEFKPLYKENTDFFAQKAISYLQSRGLTELDIKKHKIGYCLFGRYKDMVIFPYYNEQNQLVYFTGRSYLPNSSYKFSSPNHIDKNLIFDENQIDWNEPIILVESKLDAIVVRRNAIPLLGKQLTKRLILKIIQSNVDKIYICLDGDASEDTIKMASYFNKFGIDVYKVNLPENEDPCSLGFERVWEFIEKAEKITDTNLFKFKILEQLK